MFDGSDPLLVPETNRIPAERVLGIFLLAMLVATVFLHGSW